ncbi:MAG: sugar phosphate isomerase/epimerase [Planctomycetes bacterium]|nr:sugar phosphate isomerase/epimerase [Planctomycetota bacterium]
MADRTNHQDIRIGTLAPGDKGAAYLRQIIPHGFESFQLNFWKYLGGTDLKKLAKEVNALLDETGRTAIVSSLGIFGNPLEDKQTAKDWARCIDAAALFDCKLVCGFAGRVVNKKIPESMKTYKQVFGPLAKRAADKGVRLAFENCDMGGTWEYGDWNIAHAPTAWEMMFNELPAENIGLEWEPCHQMNSLIDPLPQLRKWIKKVFHIHGKDATVLWDVVRESGIRGGKPYVFHRTPGFGDTNWTDVISILRQGGFCGSIDIEGWHDPVYRGDLEMTGQVHGLNYLKQCRGGAFVENPK